MLHKIIRLLWGDLTSDELKKFSLLGLGFFCLIGSWQPLKTIKDSIFINMVGPLHLPEAKFASLLLFFPLVLMYSKLVDYFSKEKLIYAFIGIYSTIGFVLVYFLMHPTIGLSNPEVSSGRLVGWVFYLFSESYISLLLSLYWSFINDIATPESAKKGYGLIIFGTQLGGFLFTLLGSYLAYDAGLYATRVPLIALISVCMFSGLGIIVFILQRIVGYEGMAGYEDDCKPSSTVPELAVGFLEGLKLILTRPYVMGIFSLVFFQEAISTIMGFQLSLLVKTTYQDPGLVNKFLFDFGLCVQAIACLFGLIGTSFFHRKLGIRLSLIIYPALLGSFIFAYMLQPTLQTIFYVMLIAKALGYALNQPAKEVLYIPTSKNIKYKSKAWIDMFGLRFAKTFGSAINWFAGPMVMFTGTFALSLIGVWVGMASIIGNVFRKTVANKKLIE